MKTIIYALFVSLFLTLATFSQTAAGKITGTVSVASSDEVIHQASVKISELKLTTSTANDGTFVFTVPPGKYSVVVHQEGFADQIQTVTVTSGASTVADFQMQLQGVKADVTVSGSGTEVSAFESIATVNTLNSTRITNRAAVGLGD